jgi:hypothetical protein
MIFNQQPVNANHVPRHLLTASRGIKTAELVRPYLNPSWQRFRFRLEEQLADIACHPHMNPDGPRIPQRRGTPAFDWIVAEYVAGASSTALARYYHIGKGTVLRLLREYGVVIRHHRR